MRSENTKNGLTFHEVEMKVFEKYPQLEFNPARKSELTNEMITQSELYERQNRADIMRPRRKTEYQTDSGRVVVTRGKAGIRIRVF
jgi:hypothetical protein